MSRHRAPAEPSLAAPLRNREFAAVYAADVLSVAGDQVARVALSVLVFRETGSAVLTALAYAVTFLPSLFGGVLLSHAGDHLPRRTVMVASDAARAVLVAAIALPGVPLPVLLLLVFALSFAEPPFTAAQSALCLDVLPDELHEQGIGLRSGSHQAMQVIGFAVGGAVAAYSPSAGLLADAATFAAAAVIVRVLVRQRPAAAPEPVGSFRNTVTTGVRTVTGSPRLRTLLGLVCVLGVYIVGEGLVVPLAHELRVSGAGVGLLFAAFPVGGAVGAVVYPKLCSRDVRVRTLGLVCAAGGVPLLAVAGSPSLARVVCAFVLSGMLTAYLIQVLPEYAKSAPDDRRSQVLGIAGSCLNAAQGLGILIGGAAAEATSPGTAVAGSGAVIVVLGLVLQLRWRAVLAHDAVPADDPVAVVE